MKHKLLLIILLSILLFIFIFFLFNSHNYNEATVIFKTDYGPYVIQCDIAEDLESKRTGLINITYLGPDKGMLFIYNSMQPLIFTMKDMKIPLDIIFINDNLMVIDIVEGKINQENIQSNGLAQYVVEINQGLAEKNHIKIGTTLKIIYQENLSTYFHLLKHINNIFQLMLLKHHI